MYTASRAQWICKMASRCMGADAASIRNIQGEPIAYRPSKAIRQQDRTYPHTREQREKDGVRTARHARFTPLHVGNQRSLSSGLRIAASTAGLGIRCTC